MAYVSISVSPNSSTVLTSINAGSTFTTAYSGTSLVGTLTSNHRDALAFGGDRFVLVGSTGTAYSLDSGVTWTVSTTKAEANCAVYWVGNKFYYVGSSTVAYSTDGVNWTTDPVVSSTMFNSSLATDKNGIIVLSKATSLSSFTFQRSTNYGVSWESSTVVSTGSSQATYPIPIVYGGPFGFIQAWSDASAGASTYPLFVLNSINGNSGSWTNKTIHHAGDETNLRQYKELLYHSGSSLIWLGSNRSVPEIGYLSSINGVIGILSLSSASSPNVLSANGATILATSTTDTIAQVSNNNGTSWAAATARPTYGMTKFVSSTQKFAMTATTAVSASVASRIATMVRPLLLSTLVTSMSTAVSSKARLLLCSTSTGSTAALNKSMTAIRECVSNVVAFKAGFFSQLCQALSISVTSMPSKKKFWTFLWAIVYATNKWIGIKKATNTAATSTDGAVWATSTLPTTAMWCALAYGVDTAVTIATNSTEVATTLDGTNWTSRALPLSRIWMSLASNGGTTFVGVALNSDKVVTSINNGVTWTEYSLPQYSNWTSVTYGNGLFVAVCDSGIAATSADGITWANRFMPDTLQFNSVTWANNQFTAVASGPTNLAARSLDGITWERIYLPSAQNWTAIGPGVGNPNV